MGTSAIVMMIVALATVWGGFIAAVINLSRSKEDTTPDGEEHDAAASPVRAASVRS